MKLPTLTPRLSALLDEIPPGCRLVDIGTDHALIPMMALATDKVSYAIAVETPGPPLYRARVALERRGMSGQVDLRQGDGFGPVAAGEVDCAIVAGMGGHLTAEILEGAGDKLQGCRLILQPVDSARALRQWLWKRRWTLRSETLALDRGRIYPTLVAEFGTEAETIEVYQLAGFLIDDLHFLGPHLARKRDPLLLVDLRNDLKAYQKQLSRQQEGSRGAQVLTGQIQWIERFIWALDPQAPPQ